MPIEIGEITVYKLQEVADKLGVTTDTLRKYIREGRLAGQKVGGHWHVSEDALRDFFKTPWGEHKGEEKEAG